MSSPVLGQKAAKKSPSQSDSNHLFDAITKGKIHLTRFILAAANSQLANAWDPEGRTPLIACCDVKEEGTRDQIVQIILEGGADVNMTDREGRSPLIHACEKRCNDIVRILIHHHKIKPDIEDVYGNTALIYSAAVGNDVATELLTRNFRRLGLHVDHYNRQGNTALLVATKNGNMNCAKILTQKGRANVYLKDKETELTAMEWCLGHGYVKDEVDFLKPNTRFYRVAKLATSLSLSRSRSSVSSLSAEKSSGVVAPSKSVDSNMATTTTANTAAPTTTKPRGKVSLSRSKSQNVESARSANAGSGSAGGGGIFRQATMDVVTSNHRLLTSSENTSKVSDIKSSFAAGMKIKDWRTRGSKDDKKDKAKLLKKQGSGGGEGGGGGGLTAGVDTPVSVSIPTPSHGVPATSTTIKQTSPTLEECISVTPLSLTGRKCEASNYEKPSWKAGEGKGQGDTGRKSGDSRGGGGGGWGERGGLVGLGCSLSFVSVASTNTCVETSSEEEDASRPGSALAGLREEEGEGSSPCSDITYVSEHVSSAANINNKAAATLVKSHRTFGVDDVDEDLLNRAVSSSCSSDPSSSVPETLSSGSRVSRGGAVSRMSSASDASSSYGGVPPPPGGTTSPHPLSSVSNTTMLSVCPLSPPPPEIAAGQCSEQEGGGGGGGGDGVVAMSAHNHHHHHPHSNKAATNQAKLSPASMSQRRGVSPTNNNNNNNAARRQEDSDDAVQGNAVHGGGGGGGGGGAVDEYSDAGHNVMSLMKPAPDYSLQGNPAGRDSSRISSHMLSSTEISQDA